MTRMYKLTVCYMDKDTQIERRFTFQEALVHIKEVMELGFAYNTETLEHTKRHVVIMPWKIDKILVDEVRGDDTQDVGDGQEG